MWLEYISSLIKVYVICDMYLPTEAVVVSPDLKLFRPLVVILWFIQKHVKPLIKEMANVISTAGVLEVITV